MKLLPIALVVSATIIASAIIAAPKALYNHKVNQCVAVRVQPNLFNSFDPMSRKEATFYCITMQGDI